MPNTGHGHDPRLRCTCDNHAPGDSVIMGMRVDGGVEVQKTRHGRKHVLFLADHSDKIRDVQKER